MSPRASVLITGPVHALNDYAEAARAAHWEPLVRELVVIEDLTPELEIPEGVALERILITSRSAVAGLDRLATKHLELRELPCAVVGERTLQALSEAGFTVGGAAARNAESLAKTLTETLPPGSSLLWPRGSLSNQLAVDLRDAGHRVLDLVVYETRPADSTTPTPDVHAAFFASPSAVRAWLDLAHESAPERTLAIAIGETTRAELESQNREAFCDILSLPRPTPEALRECLLTLSDRTDS